MLGEKRLELIHFFWKNSHFHRYRVTGNPETGTDEILTV